MSGRARPRRLTWHDPAGDLLKWTYGLGVMATLGLLGQMVHDEHAQHPVPAPSPPVSQPDMPAGE